jgi:UDP-N-acetylmuramyl pentapeptide phosphotransferase/UDP-N-acetylglucosamine-1-phosphate transferase
VLYRRSIPTAACACCCSLTFLCVASLILIVHVTRYRVASHAQSLLFETCFVPKCAFLVQVCANCMNMTLPADALLCSLCCIQRCTHVSISITGSASGTTHELQVPQQTLHHEHFIDMMPQADVLLCAHYNAMTIPADALLCPPCCMQCNGIAHRSASALQEQHLAPHTSCS